MVFRGRQRKAHNQQSKRTAGLRWLAGNRVVHAAGDQWLRGPAPSDLKVIVVDIDRASIDALGTWPWPRETMARLVEAVATGRHPDATPAWQLQRYSGTWGNGQLRPDHVPAPRRIAGEPVRAARGPQNSGRPRRQAGQPATRMPRATPQADCRIWTARLSRNP